MRPVCQMVQLAMRVIVAGATGFIGQALVRGLQLHGDQVVALTRDPAKAAGRLPPNVEILEWHPDHPGPWMDAFSWADAAVNLSGVPVIQPLQPWTAQYRAEILNSRVVSTRGFYAALAAADPRPAVVVSQSAIGYYGSRGDTVLTEESAPGNDFLAGVVQAWEDAARPAEELGVRIVWPRTGHVLGRGGLLAFLELPFKLFLGGTLGYPDQWVSWIHLEDEVEIIRHALTHDDVRGPINATAPNPVTMQEFCDELGGAMHRPSWFPLYAPLMKLGLGQRSEAVLASDRVLPEAIQRHGYLFRHAQVGAALRSIYSP